MVGKRIAAVKLLEKQLDMIKYFFLFAMTIIGTGVMGQSEMSVFTATGRAGASTTFVTDYQSLGINPSNLGWSTISDKKVAFGLLEGGYSIYSDALPKSDLVSSLKQGETAFTYDEKVQAANQFATAGVAANVDVAWLGFSIQPNEQLGGFAFGVKDRFNWHSKFGQNLSEIIFLGFNADYFTELILSTGDTILNSDSLPADTMALIEKGISLVPQLLSELLDDSRISMAWYREYNLSYGRKIIGNDNMAIYGGIGLKYISGIAILEVGASGGVLDAYSAISPGLGIDYGDSAQAVNPSTIENSGLLPNSVGRGFGIDLGMSLIIKEKLKLGLSFNDLGSITWDGNVYEGLDDPLVDLTSPGLNNYNLFGELQNLAGDSGLFKWSGATEKKVKLPTHIRAGASFKPIDQFEVGIDVVVPVNDVAGNYGDPLFSAGLDVIPLPWIRLSTGITIGGNYGFNLPAGVVLLIGEGTWEAGLASRDILTLFSQTSPTISMTMGLLRFRF